MVIDERRDVLRRVSVLELLVVGPQLIVVSTLLLHVGRRFLKSLRPSVEISDATLVFNKMCFSSDTSFASSPAARRSFTGFEVLYSDNGGL